MWTMLAGVPGKLKTLLDRLTATRAANLDRLDETISSRAAASTALSNAVWTNTRAGRLDASVLVNGVIKSIQTHAVVGATGLQTGTGEDLRYKDVTISAVDTTRAIIILHGGGADYLVNNGTTSVNTFAPVLLRFTSAANVRIACANSAASSADRIDARFTVVEFW